MTGWLRGRPERRGQTMVEFALILPIFILVLVGMLDFGRAVYANNTVQNAAREATRLAIVDQNVSAIEAEAVSHAANLGLTADDVDVRFLQPDYSDAEPCKSDPTLGCMVEVEVRYAYNAATPIISNLVGTIDMFGASRQPIEREFTSP